MPRRPFNWPWQICSCDEGESYLPRCFCCSWCPGQDPWDSFQTFWMIVLFKATQSAILIKFLNKVLFLRHFPIRKPILPRCFKDGGISLLWTLGKHFLETMDICDQGGVIREKASRMNEWHHRRGSRGGEMGEFSPPLFLSPLLSFFFSYPSNIEMIFDFSDWGGEISPPFQNPGSAPASPRIVNQD